MRQNNARRLRSLRTTFKEELTAHKRRRRGEKGGITSRDTSSPRAEGKRRRRTTREARNEMARNWCAGLTGNGDEQEEYPRIHESAGREEAAAAAAASWEGSPLHHAPRCIADPDTREITLLLRSDSAAKTRTHQPIRAVTRGSLKNPCEQRAHGRARARAIRLAPNFTCVSTGSVLPRSNVLLSHRMLAYVATFYAISSHERTK